MKSTFRTVYLTSVHLTLFQLAYLIHASPTFQLVRIEHQQAKAQYDIQSYNDLMDQAEHELQKGGR